MPSRPFTPGTRALPIRIPKIDTGKLFPSGTGIATGLIELGAMAFFAAGVAERSVGGIAPWVVLAAVLLGLALRAVDLESSSLFIPGGLYGLVADGLGRRAARVSAAALLVEQIAGGALVASVAGHYLAALGAALFGTVRTPQGFAGEDFATSVSMSLVALVWWWQRQHRPTPRALIARLAGGVGLLLAIISFWALVTAVTGQGVIGPLVEALASGPILGGPLSRLPQPIFVPAAWLASLGFCLFAIGSVESLTHIAPELPPPTIRHLRRTARLVRWFSVCVTAGATFLFIAIIPENALATWFDAPMAGLATYLAAPAGFRGALLAGVAIAAVLFLTAAIQRAFIGAQQVLSRLSEAGVVPTSPWGDQGRFTPPVGFVDLVGMGQLAVIVASAGQLVWLSRVYAVGLAWAALLKVIALIRLRNQRPQPRAFSVPGSVKAGKGEWAIGLLLVAGTLAVAEAAVLASGDPASLAGTGFLVGLVLVLSASERRVNANPAPGSGGFEFLAAPLVGLDQVRVRPGNLLVPIRRPHSFAHLRNALQVAGDRDVVVMTVRLIGLDVAPEDAFSPTPTDDERRLFAEAVALAERRGRAVRLLIMPAGDVFEAVVDAVIHLRSTEVYVGESESLSTQDQARLLGEAWERAPKGDSFDVRLIVHHGGGRTESYQLGAHPPTLSAGDLQLIHSLWLDVVKAVGPQVHHHDVVRAALTHMEHELSTPGPERDKALEIVRKVARPADELADAVRHRDFARLRDTVRNRPPSDLAELLTDLPIEEQVVIFRVLPRKDAAATFEYLTQDAQESLLRAMAQEDVAALLNNMAPDDRTMFLEELPASVTQQMLTLLSPEERSVAVTLLGYPEGSIGRLMTPDYVAVREHWTVQEVLDHVRTHGHDSETLNVIYVVDDRGVLVDDIRIREFLLTAPSTIVSELMDRRFVALTAADDQTSAVAVFRSADRSALPVTDSAGVLIGIVTIDDVIDVAEAAATKEIQRIGGSEALDEPYMDIAFGRMIQKRAGWLTALFIGEMLTATAMAAFEHEIERAVVLALFVPLIISSGGNSGSQASTLVIRAIALGEVRLRDWWRVMRREIGAGLALGCILGTIGFTRIAVWSAFSPIYGEHWLLVAITVAIALVGVVLWGTLIGSLLPFLLRRLGFDPATSSAPFVATLVDVTGLVIYFSVGLIILRGTLL